MAELDVLRLGFFFLLVIVVMQEFEIATLKRLFAKHKHVLGQVRDEHNRNAE